MLVCPANKNRQPEQLQPSNGSWESNVRERLMFAFCVGMGFLTCASEVIACGNVRDHTGCQGPIVIWWGRDVSAKSQSELCNVLAFRARGITRKTQGKHALFSFCLLPTQSEVVAANGQYKLNTDSENVKVHAMIWVEFLREQNQVIWNLYQFIVRICSRIDQNKVSTKLPIWCWSFNSLNRSLMELFQ